MPCFPEHITRQYSIVYYFRLGPKAHVYKDPYEAGCLLCSNDGKHGYLMGLTGPLQPDTRCPLNLAKSLGFERVTLDRVRPDGSVHPVTIDLAPNLPKLAPDGL